MGTTSLSRTTSATLQQQQQLQAPVPSVRAKKIAKEQLKLPPKTRINQKNRDQKKYSDDEDEDDVTGSKDKDHFRNKSGKRYDIRLLGQVTNKQLRCLITVVLSPTV